MQNKVFIKEIFKSIQGEGLYAGVIQLFIRFSRCSLNCAYCDTDFKTNLKEYSVSELLDTASRCSNIHSIGLTGGEPLLEHEFLAEFLPAAGKKIYLETNGILFENLKKIIKYIDIISMDIKLPSCTKGADLFFEHEQFIKNAGNKELFAKIVFDENITDDEIKRCALIGAEYSIPLILQPKTSGSAVLMSAEFLSSVLYKFADLYSNVRLIPQIHKFLNII